MIFLSISDYSNIGLIKKYFLKDFFDHMRIFQSALCPQLVRFFPVDGDVVYDGFNLRTGSSALWLHIHAGVRLIFGRITWPNRRNRLK